MGLLLERQDSQFHVLARRCEYKSYKERSRLLLSILLPTLKTLPKK